jgi:hypothetical protein
MQVMHFDALLMLLIDGVLWWSLQRRRQNKQLSPGITEVADIRQISEVAMWEHGF